MEFNKTVFISDLDGTLLKSDKSLNPDDTAALDRYKSLGGRFTIATGRPLHTVYNYINELKISQPVILCNGAVIYDPCKAKILYEADLPDDAAGLIKELRSRYKNVSAEIYTFNHHYYFNLNDVEKWHQNLLGIEFIMAETPEDIDEPWIKMLFADEAEVIDDMCRYVKRFEGGQLRFVRSYSKFLEVLPDGVSKGSALGRLVDIMGWHDEFLVSAGDYDNDIEMLRRADLSFCPSNSEECVKNAASRVLKNTCDTGAVAEALEYLRQYPIISV